MTLVAALLAGYAAAEAVEAAGLWLLSRLGEYFATVASAVFLPLEVRELAKGVMLTRAGAFTINIAAVMYLLLAKYLFGLAADERPTTANAAANNFRKLSASPWAATPEPAAAPHRKAAPPTGTTPLPDPTTESTRSAR